MSVYHTQGKYERDVKNGLGKYTYLNGTVYEGEFVNGEFEGTGTCTYPDGDKYVGNKPYCLYDVA